MEHQIRTLASDIASATAKWLSLIGEYDARGGWAYTGAKSCAHWLSWMCSVSPVAARQYVRVAARLRELPQISAAFARGELSYSKVRALTRIDEVDDEPGMLTMARVMSAAQLESVLRGYRRVRASHDADRQHAERFVSWGWDDDGALVLKGRLPAEQGALLVRALEQARDAFGPPPRDSADDSAESSPAVGTCARNADALLELAEASLESGAASTTADRYQVVVHVDAAMLSKGDAPVDGECDLEAGVPLPAEAARRLGCDASIVRILERDGKPLSVGRKTRTIPPSLRRALRSRDQGCVFPGCTQTHHVDAHHIEHWADGGRTDLKNLVLLCRHHHRLLHEGGFTVRQRDGELVFARPDGQILPRSPRALRGDLVQLARNRLEFDALSPKHQHGERLDRVWAVDAVLDMCGPRRE